MSIKLLVVCALLVLSVAALSNRIDLSKPALDKDMIRELNSDNAATWEAGENEFFKGKTLKDVKDMLISRDYFAANEELDTFVHPNDEEVAKEFDSRKQWPKCIHPIRNQARCGSCWAFAASETLSDRFCVAGQDVGVLSPQYLVSCDNTDYGCQGGMLTIFHLLII
jgi:cathepsin B